MRKISKVFLSCTAAAVLTAGIATTALADANSGMTLTATYSEANSKGQIAITNCGSTDEIKTLLVLQNNKNLTNFGSSDILQIDQGENVYTVTVPAVGEVTETVTYNVYVGGTSGNVYSGTCTISAEGNNPVVSTRLLGDITGEGDIDGFDLLELAKHLGEIVTLEGDSLQAADATDDGEVDGFDILDLAKYFGELQSNVDGEKTISDKQNMVSVN